MTANIRLNGENLKAIINETEMLTFTILIQHSTQIMSQYNQIGGKNTSYPNWK